LLNNQADPNNPAADLDTLNSLSLSGFSYVWGQFLDHDLDLTPTNPAESLIIPADPFDPSRMGPQTFFRSITDPKTGTSVDNPRQQINANTAFLDLSQVYGSTAAVADALRTHVGGLMKTSPGGLLPYNNLAYFTQAELAVLDMANDARVVPNGNLFATGDVRGNETAGLEVLQTLFVRNHNRLAAALAALNPTWTDQQLYDEARQLNIATEQIITYTAYLPDMLGRGAIPTYAGYNPTVNPGIATEFSTIGFRFGHSLLDAEVERHANDGTEAFESLGLADTFFDPNVINPSGLTDPLTGQPSSDIGVFLKASADEVANEMDLLATGAIRNTLFANGGLTDNGQDLIARDLERARDHGIGSYNDLRAAYGLPRLANFSQLTNDPGLRHSFIQAYGSIVNLDPFEGGLAEAHAPGSLMGPLFTAILADQFTRLRDGDRFFYLNQPFDATERALLSQAPTLGLVISVNTGMTNLQGDVFRFTASLSGTVALADPGGPAVGQGGLNVTLRDDTGAAVAVTTTDPQGRYHFDQQSGLATTGTYTVTLEVPLGFEQTSADPEPFVLTRGGLQAPLRDFTISQIGDA
jgi:hypothetical protein